MRASGARYWMVIHKRDMRRVMCFVPVDVTSFIEIPDTGVSFLSTKVGKVAAADFGTMMLMLDQLFDASVRPFATPTDGGGLNDD